MAYIKGPDGYNSAPINRPATMRLKFLSATNDERKSWNLQGNAEHSKSMAKDYKATTNMSFGQSEKKVKNPQPIKRVIEKRSY